MTKEFFIIKGFHITKYWDWIQYKIIKIAVRVTIFILFMILRKMYVRVPSNIWEKLINEGTVGAFYSWWHSKSLGTPLR